MYMVRKFLFLVCQRNVHTTMQQIKGEAGTFNRMRGLQISEAVQALEGQQ